VLKHYFLHALIFTGSLFGVRDCHFDGRASAANTAITSKPAISTSSFASTIGVNAHLGWMTTSYGDLTAVTGALRYLDISNVRDAYSSDSLSQAASLAAKGIHFDFIDTNDSSVETFAGQLASLERSTPGAVIAVEGPNEVNTWPVTYNGQSGAMALALLQLDLYTTVKSTAALAKLPVINFSIAGLDPKLYSEYGDLSQYSDFGNTHIYYTGGQPAWGWSMDDPTYYWHNWISAAETTSSNHPVVVSETGAATLGTSQKGVDEPVQAKQVLNSIFDATLNGAKATYLYELVDQKVDPAGANLELHFGLYNSDWTPKPAAKALHNLMMILQAHGGVDASPGSLAYGLSGMPATGQSLLFAQSDGAKDIAIWAEPRIWDSTVHAEVVANGSLVTVSFAGVEASVAIYDPLVGADATQRFLKVDKVTFTLTDHPIIVEVRSGWPAKATIQTVTATR
jgi:serralysin